MSRYREYGRWAVVTGASDGLGRAMARALAAAGMDLVLCSRNETALDALAAHLEAKHGVEVEVVATDLGDPRGVTSLLELTTLLDVGILVAAAGFGTSGPLVASDLDVERNMVRVNCEAVLGLAYGYGRRFARQGRGGMILFGSLVGFQGVPGAANYAATKAYVQTLAEGLHVELAPHGVDVLSAAPGPVHSGFAARAGMKMAKALEPEPVARATLAALGRRMTVRPGWLSKLLEWSLKLPRWARVHIMGRVMAGMTAHRRAPQASRGTRSTPTGHPPLSPRLVPRRRLRPWARG
ncbi:MAG: SDR family NAD(P)-dependent oxidoreductase [Myxococcota bacterium]